MALTFNVKPESETTFPAIVPPNQKNPISNTQPSTDTYAEWDTWETINALKDSLEQYHNVTLVEANEDAFNRFRELQPDIVFNIAEGAYGVSRETQIPAMLDMLQIPYTGSDALTLGICLDKARTKEILSYYGIQNAKFKVADNIDDIKNLSFDFPLMVKPVCEGSSKGIYSSSFVRNEHELYSEVNRITNEYNQSALIEEFLPGREFTIAILGNGSDTRILPIIEIVYDRYPEGIVPLYSYEAKWILDTKESEFDVFDCPANIDPVLEEKIKRIALDTYNILRCKDWSRVDVRLDKNGEPSVIEINPLPGIIPDPTENSSFPKAARVAGMTYEDMINSVLYAAAQRYSMVK
ncbi:MAG: ATP-grasp domain-containing protein [Ignavibacteriaceae bacterium]|nr:ATP-grasp domain-containing protein [Ignavibacteriaceae bacterium]